MSETPSFEQYEAAIAQHGAHPIKVEMSVVQVTFVISALQLALRHPQFPAALRSSLTDFIQGAIEGLEGLSPTISKAMQAGNDLTQDVMSAEENNDANPHP